MITLSTSFNGSRDELSLRCCACASLVSFGKFSPKQHLYNHEDAFNKSLCIVNASSVENVSQDFIDYFVMPYARKALFDTVSKSITFIPEYGVIKRISSLGAKTLVSFKSGLSISCGLNKAFSTSLFVVCDYVDITNSDRNNDNKFSVILRNFRIFDMDVEEFCSHTNCLVKDGNLVLTVSKQMPLFSIQQIEAWYDGRISVSYDYKKVLEKVNGFAIVGGNIVELGYTPERWQYSRSEGSRNVRRYIKDCAVWRKQFENYKAAHDFLISLNLADKAVGVEWLSVNVMGGEIVSIELEKIEDHR